MAIPETPRRGVFGRLVGSISHLVASPRPQAVPPNNIAPVTPPAPVPVVVDQEAPVVGPFTPEPARDEPDTPDDWSPSMIRPKHILEMEKMWNEVIQTPKRQARTPLSSMVQARTCPPKPRNTPANRTEMPRSVLKKRPCLDDENEGRATSSASKRVKFDMFPEQRIISPPRSGERDIVPEHRVGINFSRGRKRPWATDPYMGKEFADAAANLFEEDPPAKRPRMQEDSPAKEDNSQVTPHQSGLESGDDSSCCTDNTPTTQNNTNMNETIGLAGSEAFVPTRCHPSPGTWTLDYDAYGENDEYSDLEDDELSELMALEARKGVIKERQRARANAATQAKQTQQTERKQQGPQIKQGGRVRAVTAKPNSPNNSISPVRKETVRPGRFALDFDDSRQIDDDSSITSTSKDTTPTPKSRTGTGAAPQMREAVGTDSGNGSPPPLMPSTTPRSSSQSGHDERQASDSPPDSSPQTPPDSNSIVNNAKLDLPDLPQPLPLAPNAAAIDAEMDALQWPPGMTYVESGIASQDIVDLLDHNWDDEDDFYSRQWWDREFNRFKKAMATAKTSGAELEVDF